MNKVLRTISMVLSVAVAGVVAATPMQTVKDSMSGNWPVINGQKKFISGMNLAWINFGSDVGDGVLDITSFTSKIKQIRKAGGNALRWWLHTDASNCPKIDATGAVTGLGSKTIRNLRAALDTAYSYGVVLDMCLFSFDMLVPGESTTSSPNGKASYSSYSLDNNYKFLTVPANIDTYLEKGLKPILDSVGNHPAVMCWEVFNEPEGMLASANWQHVTKKLTQQEILRITNKVAGFVHRNSKKMVSTGIASASYVSEYSDAKLKAAGADNDGYLDFYMVHYYPEWQDESLSPFHHPETYWNMDRPVLIGEFPAKDWSASQTGPSSNQPLKTTKTIVDAYNYAYANGYAGAMSWAMTEANSFFGDYTTTAPALTALFSAHKSDIMIKDVAIENMSGNYVMKLTLTNLAIPSGDAGYNELGTSFSKSFAGKTNIVFDLFVAAGSGKNATIVPVIKVGSAFTWSPAQNEALLLSDVEQGKWITVTIPVSAFGAGDVSVVKEFLFQYWATGTPYTGTLYFDNVRVDSDTLGSFNAEGSAWGTKADAASVALVKFSDVTGVSRSARSIGVEVQPAIFSHGKSVRFNFPVNADARVELVDLRGKMVAGVSFGTTGAGVHTLRFDAVAPGQYVCNVYQNNRVTMAHIVLQ